MSAGLLDPTLEKLYIDDQKVLAGTKIPIITVSGTYREDLKGMHGLPENETLNDVVFSRAHFSMAVGIATQAWGDKIDPKKAWLADPTNYVSQKNWGSIQMTENIGKAIARHDVLKNLKAMVDKFGRKKLPILDSITPPLLYLTQHIKGPILSLHIATGNILAEHGKTVVQVITDPHVRYDYLTHADKPNLYFCVFDQATKDDFLEKASLMGQKANADHVIVTGPPIDPRIIACREKKNPWRSGVLKLCLTTGGLGTNKSEILHVLEQLLPELRRHDPRYRLLIYAGTHADIVKDVREMAQSHHVAIGKLTDRSADLRVIYHPQILDANELLIRYGFPWAHGFITKPSGDMAYDAMASGSFLLTLEEWGEWEHNIREIFEQKGVSREAVIEQMPAQLESLTSAQNQTHSWVERAMLNAFGIDKLFLHGSKEILKAFQTIADKTEVKYKIRS